MIIELTLEEALMQALLETQRMQVYAAEVAALLPTQNTSSHQLVDYFQNCGSYLGLMARARAIPGIQQYAKDQLADQAKDFNTWALAVEAAVVAWATELYTSAPTDTGSPGGWLQERKLATDGTVTVRQYTPAQTATLTTLAQAIADVAPLRT